MSFELSSTAGAASDSARDARPADELARWTAAAMLILFWLLAAVLGWRRVAGGLSTPLRPEALLLVGAVTAVGALAVRLAWRHRRGRGHTGRGAGLVSAGISVGVVAAGAAVSLPGTSTTGLIFLWAILAIEECGVWGKAGVRRGMLRRRRSPLAIRERRFRSPSPLTGQPPVVAPAWAAPPADEVTQQLARSRAADGTEVISGWLRVALAAGQRSTNVHLAFCPPFARSPKVAIRQVEGPEARIKTVQVLPYGARFDLKLAAPSEAPATVLLQVAAESEPAARPGGDPIPSDADALPDA